VDEHDPLSASAPPGSTEAADLDQTMMLETFVPDRPMPSQESYDTPTAHVTAVEVPLRAQLTIERGPDTGGVVRLLGAPMRLGRSPDNELMLRDPATSGHHARVELRGPNYWVIDLGSTNGTLVNGEPVQEKELRHGDHIIVGQNSVKFELA
jgi:pSer/pThr/pTyr-binding forkhead associated (FHA) protein